MRTSMRELKTPDLELAGSKVRNSKNGVVFCWKKIKKQTYSLLKKVPVKHQEKVPGFFKAFCGCFRGPPGRTDYEG